MNGINEKEARYLESVVRYAVGKYGQDAMREMAENAEYLGKMMVEYNKAFAEFFESIAADKCKRGMVEAALSESVYNELRK